jgi:hypothetical protein
MPITFQKCHAYNKVFFLNLNELAFYPLLVFINAQREFHKRIDTIIACTQEYSRVSYLSTRKQWLKKLIIHHHVSTNLIYQLD